MMYLNLLLIQFIIVFIIDLSGVIYYFKKLYCRLLFGKYYPKNLPYTLTIKPIDCSLCLSFWFGLLYLLIIHHLTLFNISIVCLLAYMTPFTKELILTIKELLINTLLKINK